MTSQDKFCRDAYIIEEVVGTSQLLQRLQNHTQGDTVQHARSGDELVPHLLLGFGVELLLDLLDFLEDDAVVLGDTIELGHGVTSTIDTAVTELETWALREASHATTENESKEEGKTQGNPPLLSAFEMLGSQVNAVGKEDTKSDEQLVATDHGTTDLARSTLTLVHGNEQGATTNAKTSHPTAHDHLNPFTGRGRDLNNQADIEDDTPESDRPFTTKLIGYRSGNQSTNQGTDG